MGLKICVLGSGSKGNCTCIWSNKTALLIDVGLSLGRIEKCLSIFGIQPSSVSILLTHTHSDHISGLEKFVKKYGNEVYVSSASYDTLIEKCNIPISTEEQSDKINHTILPDLFKRIEDLLSPAK